MAPILFLLFIAVPLLELAVIIQVGRVIGAPETVLALLVVSVVGAALVKREGLRAWGRFRQALLEGRPPAREVIDGALLLLGGALLLTPGFVTDAVGLLLLLPWARAGVRRLLRDRFALFGLARDASGGRPQAKDRPRTRDGVVDVEVVEIRRSEPPEDRGPSA